MAMANGCLNDRKTQKVRRPPKRGQIKVKIFHSFLKMVSKIASKAMTLGIKEQKQRREGGIQGRSASSYKFEGNS